MPTLLTTDSPSLVDDHNDSLTSEQLIEWAIDQFGVGLVMSTSFGIQSAVMLHLATSIREDIPVIWVDTGYLPPETYEYAETMRQRLNLNLHVAQSPISPADMEARFGRLWESDNVEDLTRYDRIRKVEPMQRTLRELKATAWISGLRADQTDYRSGLPRCKQSGSLLRIYPILHWSKRQVWQYLQEFSLPQHPLRQRGYTTVGDDHSSRPVMPSDNRDRDTRFRGKKQECGLHLF